MTAGFSWWNTTWHEFSVFALDVQSEVKVTITASNRESCGVAVTFLCHHQRGSVLAILYCCRLPSGRCTREHHSSTLHLPAGENGLQIFRSRQSAVVWWGPRSGWAGNHCSWTVIVEAERETVVGVESPITSTVCSVSWCTQQDWTGLHKKYTYWWFVVSAQIFLDRMISSKTNRMINFVDFGHFYGGASCMHINLIAH